LFLFSRRYPDGFKWSAKLQVYLYTAKKLQIYFYRVFINNWFSIKFLIDYFYDRLKPAPELLFGIVVSLTCAPDTLRSNAKFRDIIVMKSLNAFFQAAISTAVHECDAT